MTPSRKKLITTSVLILGVAVVVVAGIMLYPSLRERYWIWKLETGTGKERWEAAERLGEFGSVRAIPSLIDALAAATDQSGNIWWIERSTSRFSFSSVQVQVRDIGEGNRITSFSSVTLPAVTYDAAIRSISKRSPEHAERLLRSCLTNDKEIVRAAAASVLFDGRKGAWEYVCNERLVPPPPR